MVCLHLYSYAWLLAILHVYYISKVIPSTFKEIAAWAYELRAAVAARGRRPPSPPVAPGVPVPSPCRHLPKGLHGLRPRCHAPHASADAWGRCLAVAPVLVGTGAMTAGQGQLVGCLGWGSRGRGGSPRTASRLRAPHRGRGALRRTGGACPRPLYC